jgi:hypothetical protein
MHARVGTSHTPPPPPPPPHGSVLSLLDLECAYEAKLWQLHELGSRHTTATKDVMAQLIDLVEPSRTGQVTKLDMKRTNCSRLVFDILISLKPCAAARNYL